MLRILKEMKLPISVEQCLNFKHNVCTKCGRMMPDFCHDQQTLEDKAKKFDEMMAKQATEAPGHTDLMVTPESIEDITQEDTETVVMKTQVPLPTRLKKK